MIGSTGRRAFAAMAVAALAACSGIPANPASPSASDSPPSAPRLIQVVIDPGLLPFGGGTAVVRLAVVGVDGTGVRDATVMLSVSGGTLAADRAVTDPSGYAKVEWTGTTTAMITASLGGLSTDTMIAVDVPAADPPPVTSPPSPPAPAPLPPLPQPPAPEGSQLRVLLGASPEQALEGEAITFMATARGLDNENVTSYEWDFDGNGTTDETTSEQTRVHVYATNGVKNPRVTIRTTAQHVATGTRAVTIGVGPAAMSVVLTSTPASAPAGSAISFTAIVTMSAAAGTATLYTWDWDTSAAATPAVTSTATTSHAYQTPGARTARVTVTSSTGMTATSTAGVDVTPAPTTATVTLSATPQSAIAGQPVTFTAVASSTGSPGKVIGYDWDWDTGEDVTPKATSQGPVFLHTYATAGTRRALVTVTYESGVTASASVAVSVTSPPP